MTRSRRPTNFAPPNNIGQDSDGGEEEELEELEDLEEEGLEGSDNEDGIASDDSTGSGPPTPLTREIRLYEERNEELTRRLREFEEERRHQADVKEIWENTVALMEVKLSCLCEKVEGVDRTAMEGEKVDFTTEDLEMIDNIEKQLEHLRMLIRGSGQNESGSDHQPEVVSDEGSNMEAVDQTDETQANAN